MRELLDFNDLFVLDLANNHQGDLNHGINIIQLFSDVLNTHKVKAGIKFQYRDLDSFIHPDYQNKKSNKMVKRFLDTKLNIDEFASLKDCVKKNNLLAICTPFDEQSVERIVHENFDILKVASASITDWPLIREVALSKLPVILSTGGCDFERLDYVVDFLEQSNCHFALSHCVSIYPTEDNQLNLKKIQLLKKRYPEKVIGWSTHENPENTQAISIAYGLGARIFERHIGIETDKYQLNQYSSTPTQISKWIESWKKARVMVMGDENTKNLQNLEKKQLETLRRGVFTKEKIKTGKKVSKDNCFFAIPAQQSMDTFNLKDHFSFNKAMFPNQTVWEDDITSNPNYINNALTALRSLIRKNSSLTHLSKYPVNIYHHKGIENFHHYGAFIFEIVEGFVNKKVIVLMPNQEFPSHQHCKKSELFTCLHGEFNILTEKGDFLLKKGDHCQLPPNTKHKILSNSLSVIEEISDHPHDNSLYCDYDISNLDRKKRITVALTWGANDK